MKKCVFLVRSDYASKPGGDISLIKSFQTVFSYLGFECILVSDPFALVDDCAFAFLINLDRPIENYIFVKRSKERNIPVFLYALHHSKLGIEKYLNEMGSDNVRGFLSLLAGNNFLLYESLMSFIRVLVKSNFKYFLYPLSFSAKHSSQYLLGNTHVLTTGKSEKKSIETDYKCKFNQSEISFLPHILDATLNRENCPIKIKKLIVCAGRIEPRKNQKSVLKVAELLPDFKFVFVGGMNPSANSYFEQFKNLSAGMNNVETYDSMPLSSLKNLFLEAEIFISLSYFEVVSLTELEAYAANCKMVVTKHSYLVDFVEKDECISYVEPDSINDAVLSIIALSKREVESELRLFSLKEGRSSKMNKKNITANIIDIFGGYL